MPEPKEQQDIDTNPRDLVDPRSAPTGGTNHAVHVVRLSGYDGTPVTSQDSAPI